jgi:hypothetical protein
MEGYFNFVIFFLFKFIERRNENNQYFLFLEHFLFLKIFKYTYFSHVGYLFINDSLFIFHILNKHSRNERKINR